MNRKEVLLVLLVLLLIYPAFSIYELQHTLKETEDLDQVYELAVNYQISIWISWVIMVSVAVYYKWSSKKRNFFFYFTYAFLFLAFGIFGFYMQEMVNAFEIASRFSDNYSLGVFKALQNFAVAAILTGFLQGAVWWFSSKWHRR